MGTLSEEERRLWLTVAEAARQQSVSAQVVRRKLRRGELRGRKVGKGRGTWRVLASALDRQP